MPSWDSGGSCIARLALQSGLQAMDFRFQFGHPGLCGLPGRFGGLGLGAQYLSAAGVVHYQIALPPPQHNAQLLAVQRPCVVGRDLRVVALLDPEAL